MGNKTTQTLQEGRWNMIIIIPEHVKNRVDRIIAEYEKMLTQKRAIFHKVSANGVDYYGVDTTRYYVEHLKEFRKELDEQKSPLFTGTPEEIQAKIKRYIEDFYDALSIDAIYEVNKNVFTQKQLMKALRKARKDPKFENDAIMLMHFINAAKSSSWGQDDENFDTKYFKLVHSKEEFEEIIRRAEPNLLGWELTPGTIDPFKHIRVAFVEVPFHEQYRKKGIYRAYQAKAKKHDFWHGENKVFDFWNDITRTCTYYVYIPQK